MHRFVSSWFSLSRAILVSSAFAFVSASAAAQIVQQGVKLVGTGGVGSIDGQGNGVALSADGNTAIVGGPDDNSGIGGVWVFTRTAGVWSQQGPKLVGTLPGAYQGTCVAVSADGNTLVEGGNSGPGGAWVFVRSFGAWSQQGVKLVGAGAVGNAEQGTSISLSGDGNTMIVGGPSDNTFAGAAWVFTRTGGVWSQQGGKLVGTGATGNAHQGTSVAVSADGNTAFVGGPSDNGGTGATWVFTRTGGVWSQQGAKLVGTAASGTAQQGSSVAASADGNTIIVGAPADAASYGATWVFTRTGGVWTQQGPKLVGITGADAGSQGASVGLSADGNAAIVGGYSDASAAFGAAWVFTRTAGVWSQSGSKLVGTGFVIAAYQGLAVAMAADGATMLVGGPNDNSGIGATWVFVRAAPKIVAIRDIPNDQGGRVSIRWDASLLDNAPSNPIDSYWIWRQVPIHGVAQMQGVGREAPATRTTRTNSGQTYYWEFVGSQVAHGYPAYGYTASTTSDSVSGSNPYTLFMVEAERTSTGEYWSSAPDSGYSVDNLSPIPPGPMTAAYEAGATHLHWSPSSDVDFATFNVYRGTSAGFVPGPGNLVTSQPDTGYADAGPAGRYYKLSAEDTHGNESAFALITPSNTVGIGRDGVHELLLAPVSPNPLHGGGEFHYSLPHEISATVAIFDTHGRRVRTLSRGLQPAGDHVVAWNGRDESGAIATNGIFFLRLDAGSHTRVAKFVEMH